MTLGSGMALGGEPSETEPMRFIQMWILPAERGLEPGVEQHVFWSETAPMKLLLVISGDGGDAVLVHQDADVLVSRLNPGVGVEHPLRPSRGVYLYVIDRGVEGERRGDGDRSAAQLADEDLVGSRGAP